MNNGGPAFPTTAEDFHQGFEGMSLRDYFAAKAMQGLIGRVWEDKNGKVPDDIFQIWARSAYGMADEMLKAREEQP